MKGTPHAEDTTERLDRIIELLEDLFILQASIARMKRQELRGVVGLDMKRVNRISKHLKPLSEEDTEGAARPVPSGGNKRKAK
jgi:hypothetical protein